MFFSQGEKREEFYPSGKLKSLYTVDEKGIKSGVEKFFDQKGFLKEKKVWKKGKIIDTIFRYYKLNRTKKLVKAFDNNENILFEGIKIDDFWDGNVFFYKEGNIKSVKSFKDNVEKGMVLLFDGDTNRLKYMYESDNKKRNGIKIEFKDGRLKSFRESNLYSDGQYIEFFHNGSIKLLGFRRQGKSDGWFYQFNEDGWIISKRFYSMGELVEIN